MKDKHPTFWATTEKIDGIFKPEYKYVKGDIPNTKYVILFNLRTDTRIISFSKSLYDSKAECFKECDELDKMYFDHPLPIKVREEVKNKYTGKITYYDVFDYSNGKSWWGYIVLDFELCKIIRIGGSGFLISPNIYIKERDVHTHLIDKMSIANMGECRDYFFRDVDKVPDNYSFDDGEYEGWLQYRWGDGKNAIDYVKPPKKKKQIREIDLDAENDNLEDFSMPDNYEADLIEERFADLLDKETINKLHARYW